MQKLQIEEKVGRQTTNIRNLNEGQSSLQSVDQKKHAIIFLFFIFLFIFFFKKGERIFLLYS